MTFNDSMYCSDLPTTPRSGSGKILVSGASGYIGGRLVPELLERGYRLRVMVRTHSPEFKQKWPEAEIVVADAMDIDSLDDAFKGVHTAYFLIHSLLMGPEKLAQQEVIAAENFRKKAEKHKLQRIIYLCGLGNIKSSLSSHLSSRMKVAEILQKGSVPVTILRAAIIIGSGSASYEIIMNLVKNMPFMLIPKWANTLCQPIGIRDVIKYLVGSLEKDETIGRQFDIGGKDVLSYISMIKTIATIMDKKCYLIPSPISNYKLYAYFAGLVTPVPAQITMCLFEGGKNEVVCQDNDILNIIKFEPLYFKESISRAISVEKHGNICSKWSDAYPPSHSLATKLNELEKPARYRRSYSILTDKDASSLFSSLCNIGGKRGWYAENLMWRMRGYVDRILMGVRKSRGRMRNTVIGIDDVINFWRVENLVKDKSMLLRAEMVLPGQAWLEFNIDPCVDINRLSVIAYFQPRNYKGHLYWYSFRPFHYFIFRKLLKQIEIRS